MFFIIFQAVNPSFFSICLWRFERGFLSEKTRVLFDYFAGNVIVKIGRFLLHLKYKQIHLRALWNILGIMM